MHAIRCKYSDEMKNDYANSLRNCVLTLAMNHMKSNRLFTVRCKDAKTPAKIECSFVCSDICSLRDVATVQRLVV
jgi:hypothetical protein